MATFTVNNVSIAGIAACVPRNKVANSELTIIPEKEIPLLIKTTGIAFRRIAHPSITAADLCEQAALKLIADLNWNKDEIDLLVFVSQSPDYRVPSNAPLLQHKLGLNKNCMAFDINLGCSGYVYGLSVVSNFIATGAAKKALMLVGEIAHYFVSPNDKSTLPIFGDAGTATALTNTEHQSFSFNLQSDGSGFNAIIVNNGGARNAITADSLITQKAEEGIYRNDLQLIMDGIKVYKFSTREVADNIEKLLSFTKQNNTDFDYFIFHQANLLLNEVIRKKLELPANKVPYSLPNFGNTSSATIPLTMVTQLQQQLREQQLQLILSGFGVGLSWGSAAVTTNKICCPDLIEI